jgi:chemotaxis regulatin CheY-phosphate phosphatase CheZ
LLERANGDINGLLTRLRESRGALQATAVDKLTHTQRKLREVTNATELAATDIMDACDRATGRLDALDALDGGAEPDRAAAAAIRLELRDELFTMMSALQFQDLTTQMLSHATAVLTEVEERLQDVASLFEGAMQSEQPDAAAGAERPARSTNLAYDPNASVENAERRQAVADSVFAPAVGGVAAA